MAHDISDLLGFLLGIAILAAVITAFWFCLNWTLGPLDRAAKNRRFPVQFSLADLLCLFVLVQLPLGVAHWAGGNEIGPSAVIAVVIAALAGIVWWKCVRTLSRAGIHVVWHRCVVLVAIPFTMVATYAVLILPLAAIGSHESTAAFWLLAAELPLLGALYALGRFTRAIVASAEARRNETTPRPPVEQVSEPVHRSFRLTRSEPRERDGEPPSPEP